SNTPPETERDDNDETAIEDLKVLESQEVFDDEGGDEDNNGEAVDGDYAESIEDLANEVVELIEKSKPGSFIHWKTNNKNDLARFNMFDQTE
ncbi:hypothetical protein BGZ75_009111, partial [Mortierella antarctica]